MSKKSFNDIELVIKNTLEANEPAFNEESWIKMERLLDKDGNRKRPFAFWLWFLVPLLIAAGGISYFVYNEKSNEGNMSDKGSKAEQVVSVEQKNQQQNEQVNSNTDPEIKDSGKSAFLSDVNDKENKTGDNVVNMPGTKKSVSPITFNNSNAVYKDEILSPKNKLTDNTKGKIKASITAASPEGEDDLPATEQGIPAVADNNSSMLKEDEVIVVKIETDIKADKEIEKIIDSVIQKSVANTKDERKISRVYIIVAGGAETSGTKLFSADKITGRVGLAAGYNLNKNLSVQAGFFMSNKKYKADGSSYKTKPGTYWNIVNIEEIDANCKIYEIPLQVNYNFTPGKKLNIFASAGLSSYIMKKENYSFYYYSYGTAHQANVNYSGNKNLFSVLRISGGIEKKIAKQFSLFAAPGIAIPIAGVGEGEVKLYSTEILIGLKFTPSRRIK